MLIELPKNWKVKFRGNKKIDVLSQIGYYLIEKIETNKQNIQLDVSKMWVNEKTYDDLTRQLKKQAKRMYPDFSDEKIEKEVSMFMFNVGPACDLKNEMNIPNNTYLLNEGIIKEKEIVK